MKTWIRLLGVFLFLSALLILTMPAWAGEEEYQDCLRLQQQGYAIHCIPPLSYLYPCDRPHEIEYEADVIIDGRGRSTDWGNPRCRFVLITGMQIFGGSSDAIFGLRSDGVVVWRYQSD